MNFYKLVVKYNFVSTSRISFKISILINYFFNRRNKSNSHLLIYKLGEQNRSQHNVALADPNDLVNEYLLVRCQKPSRLQVLLLVINLIILYAADAKEKRHKLCVECLKRPNNTITSYRKDKLCLHRTLIWRPLK